MAMQNKRAVPTRLTHEGAPARAISSEIRGVDQVGFDQAGT
jgi:hypothetical protein